MSIRRWSLHGQGRGASRASMDGPPTSSSEARVPLRADVESTSPLQTFRVSNYTSLMLLAPCDVFYFYGRVELRVVDPADFLPKKASRTSFDPSIEVLGHCIYPSNQYSLVLAPLSNFAVAVRPLNSQLETVGKKRSLNTSDDIANKRVKQSHSDRRTSRSTASEAEQKSISLIIKKLFKSSKTSTAVASSVMLLVRSNPMACKHLTDRPLFSRVLSVPAMRKLHAINPTEASLSYSNVTVTDREQRLLCRYEYIPRDWQGANSHIIEHISGWQDSERPPIVLVCGSAGSGKSTFIRQLVNRVMSNTSHDQVGLLDIDVGQPELSPPGMVSYHTLSSPLLLPSLITNHTPTAARYFGGVTAENDVFQYESYVLSLWEEVRAKHLNARIPIFVNTCGWVDGSGIGILNQLLLSINPSYVVQFRKVHFSVSQESQIRTIHATQEDIFDGEHSNQPWTRSILSSIVEYDCGSSPVTLTKKDRRTLKLASYFYWQMPGTLQLYSTPPFTVNWNDIRIAVLNHSLDQRLLPLSINAAIVSLSEYSEEEAEKEDTTHLRLITPHHDLPCFGLAIVRTVDSHTRTLQLLSPTDITRTPANLLVKGDIELPVELLQEDQEGTVPYLCPNSLADTVGGARPMKSRRNILR